MKEDQKNKVLLESGTNEIEIMEFTIDDNLYGINVAKVREIMMSAPIKPMPHANPMVEGIFKPRDTVLTVVDLPKYLNGDAQSEKSSKDLFIVTNFNKMYIAFRVHTVVGISRISWKDIQKPDKAACGGDNGVASGIAQCGDELVTILDFEKIVAEIASGTAIQMSQTENLDPGERSNLPIVIAEDSPLLSRMMFDALKRAGYSNLTLFPNGQELWDYLCKAKEKNEIAKRAALVITDMEMPQMDGHRLTKLVKEDPALKAIPLIIVSSLISNEMRLKGKQLGADEQLSKPEIGHLVGVMDQLLLRTAR